MLEALQGPCLYLGPDAESVVEQLSSGVSRPTAELLRDISTDEIIPAWACYYVDERLQRFALVGLRGFGVKAGQLKDAPFRVLVAGEGFGCGSSRETAPYALKAAGIELIVARSFERIFHRNCHNLGLLTSTDPALVVRLERGEMLPTQMLLAGLGATEKAIVQAGGLLAHAGAGFGLAQAELPQVAQGPKTLVEKILEAHAAQVGEAPEFVRADWRFSHEYVTAMAERQLVEARGEGVRLFDPDKIVLFRDHLTLLEPVMPEHHRRLGLLEPARELASAQEAFAQRHGLLLYKEREYADGLIGSEGICHNVMLERHVLPGELVVGTDSHTCTLGAVGCLALGVGSTEMASAWLSGRTRVGPLQTIRVELKGQLPAFCTAKDVMLRLLADAAVRNGEVRGKVLEFCGEGVSALSIEERATLTNLAVETGAATGIVAPDAVTLAYLSQSRGEGTAVPHLEAWQSDLGATYAGELEVDLAALEPWVALPGSPRQGRPLSALHRDLGPVRIDIAYGGSCTGSKRTDWDQYALVLRQAHARGMRIAPGVRCFIQLGSARVEAYARAMGYLELFRAMGVELLGPACGACIGAGPGMSSRAEQITVSSMNRNFPGRSGPGQVYLASPLVVAASAVLGRICDQPELLELVGQ